MPNVLEMKKAVAGILDARSVDMNGFYDGLTKYGGTEFFRVVVRDRDAVDVAAGHYLPRRENEAQASVATSDITGLANYLLGRPDQHDDFRGLQGPFDGKDEVELQQADGSWINAKTGEVTQADKGAMPEPLAPPQS